MDSKEDKSEPVLIYEINGHILPPHLYKCVNDATQEKEELLIILTNKHTK